MALTSATTRTSTAAEHSRIDIAGSAISENPQLGKPETRWETIHHYPTTLPETPAGRETRDLMSILRRLNIPIVDFKIEWESRLGAYLILRIDGGARQALEHWLRILDTLEGLNLPIFVTWTGEVDVSPEEMGRYVGRALAKMKLSLVTEEPVDAVKMLREEWGDLGPG